MQFRISEIQSQHSLSREEEFDATKLLGNPPEFVKFTHPVNAKVQADLIYSEILISGTVSTIVNLSCARCLEVFERKIEGGFKQAYSLDGMVIDLTPELKETILIDIPFNALCKEDCKGLCPYCGKNKNFEECLCEREKANPRWDILKEIKFKG